MVHRLVSKGRVARLRALGAGGLALALAASCTLDPPAHVAQGGASGAAGNVPSGGGSGTQPTGTAAASGSAALGGKSSGSGGKEPSGGSSGGISAGGSGSGGDLIVGEAGASGASGGEAPACSPPCEGTGICRDGECQCNGDLAYCDGECVDTKTDAKHCGSGCGVSCTAGRNCVAGACKCPSGTFCNGACVDTTSDPAHCGACDKICQGASECLTGACKTCSTGCAVLSATVTDNSASPFVRFGITLNPPIDLVGAAITARLYVASNVQPTTVQVHIDDTTDSSSSGMYAATAVGTSGWFVAEMFVTASNIDLLEVMLQDFSGVGGAAVYLDSISISTGVAGPWEFTSAAAPLTYSIGVGVDPSDISGSVSWRNN